MPTAKRSIRPNRAAQLAVALRALRVVTAITQDQDTPDRMLARIRVVVQMAEDRIFQQEEN